MSNQDADGRFFCKFCLPDQHPVGNWGKTNYYSHLKECTSQAAKRAKAAAALIENAEAALGNGEMVLDAADNTHGAVHDALGEFPLLDEFPDMSREEEMDDENFQSCDGDSSQENSVDGGNYVADCTVLTDLTVVG